uniref:BBC1/AIM3 cysteine proteinase-fold domain-containing protein n=1 Tax=Palpitomonas bilix TaxID=652834 RepID=A0A7S3D184_9EUKA|mmetsp:Transcript_18112/g.45237  ORF Transcript_18112/g.45237 Transcript_18112/m.45237 type:complete len:411 (+) Transcript_18112:215-1447(+)
MFAQAGRTIKELEEAYAGLSAGDDDSGLEVKTKVEEHVEADGTKVKKTITTKTRRRADGSIETEVVTKTEKQRLSASRSGGRRRVGSRGSANSTSNMPAVSKRGGRMIADMPAQPEVTLPSNGARTSEARRSLRSHAPHTPSATRGGTRSRHSALSSSSSSSRQSPSEPPRAGLVERERRGALAIPDPPELQLGDRYRADAKIVSKDGGRTNTVTITYDIERIDGSRLMVVREWECLGQPGTLQMSSSKVTSSSTLPPPPPLSDEKLRACAKEYGPKIVRYCSQHLGKKIDRGECWDLVRRALEHVSARRARSFDFGQRVDLEDVMPGDLLHFKNCVFKGKSETQPNTVVTKTVGLPDHAAVVEKVNLPILFYFDQNHAGRRTVGRASQNMDHYVSGLVEVFRAVPPPDF